MCGSSGRELHGHMFESRIFDASHNLLPHCVHFMACEKRMGAADTHSQRLHHSAVLQLCPRRQRPPNCCYSFCFMHHFSSAHSNCVSNMCTPASNGRRLLLAVYVGNDGVRASYCRKRSGFTRTAHTATLTRWWTSHDALVIDELGVVVDVLVTVPPRCLDGPDDPCTGRHAFLSDVCARSTRLCHMYHSLHSPFFRLTTAIYVFVQYMYAHI